MSFFFSVCHEMERSLLSRPELGLREWLTRSDTCVPLAARQLIRYWLKPHSFSATSARHPTPTTKCLTILYVRCRRRASAPWHSTQSPYQKLTIGPQNPMAKTARSLAPGMQELELDPSQARAAGKSRHYRRSAGAEWSRLD